MARAVKLLCPHRAASSLGLAASTCNVVARAETRKGTALSKTGGGWTSRVVHRGTGRSSGLDGGVELIGSRSRWANLGGRGGQRDGAMGIWQLVNI
ncbi:hypothetical protein PR202_gb22953 [Eleusine coracana subsp. coracana]|uniref:Secreted protein n=1 Tax=Eleusine coracana subsp. coracana TaxID=191504 RepID=A0AAV5FF22_ELECO|nr:hypothetical protein PR202_gb22953 [Eleusine coracana subsp. coracana]